MRLYCTASNRRNGSAAVRRLLAHALDELYSIQLPEIRCTSSGKPYFPAHPHLCFSFSHTDTHALCAVDTLPLGADIQTLRPIRPHTTDRVCCPEELENFDFFDIWTLKESYVKLFDAPRTNFRSVCFAGTRENIITPENSFFAKIYDDIPGCRAAVCAVSPNFPEQITIL